MLKSRHKSALFGNNGGLPFKVGRAQLNSLIGGRSLSCGWKFSFTHRFGNCCLQWFRYREMVDQCSNKTCTELPIIQNLFNMFRDWRWRAVYEISRALDPSSQLELSTSLDKALDINERRAFLISYIIERPWPAVEREGQLWNLSWAFCESSSYYRGGSLKLFTARFEALGGLRFDFKFEKWDRYYRIAISVVL